MTWRLDVRFIDNTHDLLTGYAGIDIVESYIQLFAFLQNNEKALSHLPFVKIKKVHS